jgi:hypothetical protein
MSLLTYASPWTSDEGNNKKRTPTIRKNTKTSTIVNDSGGEPEEYTTTANAPTSNNAPISLDEVKNYQDEKGTKVHELLNKMSAMDSENDGAHLANFSPLAPPVLSAKPQYTQKQSNPYGEPELNNPNNAKSMYVYSADDRSLGNLPNYQNVYENKMLFQKDKPYYANMGIPTGSTTGMDNKLMERINYMVHLLEEQQHEKTANVTEEFLLYTFLGVFVIYVVDTFSRNGKYVR